MGASRRNADLAKRSHVIHRVQDLEVHVEGHVGVPCDRGDRVHAERDLVNEVAVVDIQVDVGQLARAIQDLTQVKLRPRRK